MLLGLEGRYALVTGSDRGIGRAIALALAHEGVNVLIHSGDDPARAEATAAEARDLGVQAVTTVLDFSADDAARILYDRSLALFPRIDILVVNASAQINQTWNAITLDAFDIQVRVNLRATIEIIRAFLPPMTERGWGRVLTIGSVQQTKPHWKTPVYAMTKAAQSNLIHNLAKQYSQHGVTFNNLSPGFTATDRTAESMRDTAYMSTVISGIPAGRIGEPDDCAGAAVFLCSEPAGYITGVDLYVDGGMHLT
ncbi:MAG TPA: SDR family oxidoreductase [Aggregatilineales bacterium]|jgi:NAD(P)-dependent dehydrogenase (short-subunit alcohol dehydrogenase family)|nr:SDR family oxidoreductase [Aggregatilineales bacterium]